MKKQTANVLYFEGAGMDFYNGEQKSSDVGNFRIRTSFLNNEGEQYYIEVGNGYRMDKKGKSTNEMHLRIDHLFRVCDKLDNPYSSYEMKKDYKALRELDYTKENITNWINDNLNCSFDSIEVLNSFYGYRVHADNGLYNLVEHIELNHERATARQKAYDKIDMEYRELLNEKYSKIGMNEMDSESITIRCYASSNALENAGLERFVCIPVSYEGVKA